MALFDLLFLGCFLAAAIVLLLTAFDAMRARRREAFAKLRTLTICAGIYMIAVLAAGLAFPPKTYRIGDTQCFDDWCIAVVNVARTQESVVVNLQLSSRARRSPQGEKGTVVYLRDSENHRYDPMADPDAARFDTLLQPGESAIAVRHFIVPSKARDLQLIYTHEGGFPIWSFVIGENEWFHGPPRVRLDE